MSLRKALFAPEGEGYLLVKPLAMTAHSKTTVVRSIKTSKPYVRKEALPTAKVNYSIQNIDVRAAQPLAAVAGMSKLEGWTKYTNPMSRVVSGRFTNSGKRIPYDCLWSIALQMIKIMLDTVEAGTLHTDAHASNWFIGSATTGDQIRLVLGDWGMIARRPRSEEDRNAMEAWFKDVRSQLRVHVIDEIRALMILNAKGTTTNTKLRINDLVSMTSPNMDWLAKLECYINCIDECAITDFATGEKWLEKVKSLYNEMSSSHEGLSPLAIPSADVLIELRPEILPSFMPCDAAITALEDWNEIDDEGSPAVFLWLVAHLDQTGNITQTERPPPQFSKCSFTDGTLWYLTPDDWRAANDETIQLVRHHIADFGCENSGDDFNYQGDMYGDTVYGC